MDKLFQHNISEEGEHPSHETLLLYVDGELNSKEGTQAQAHLESCWSCRVRIKRIEETIADIIEFDEEVLKPRLLPPNKWRSFDRRLNQLAAEGVRPSLLSRVLGSFGRLFSKTSFFFMLRPLARLAVGLLVAVIILTFVIRFDRDPVVSASDFLRNVTEARVSQISKTPQPVVHQQLRVRRKGGATSGTESVNWEIWNDAVRPRFRQSVTEGGSRRFLPAAVSAEPEGKVTPSFPSLLTDLDHVLRANRMDPQHPLTATSFQSWRDSLGQKQDEITRTKLPGDIDTLTLRTAPTGEVRVGQITEAVLVVRARDWHPGELHLRIRAEGEDREYELVETAFEVLSLPALSAEIFPDQSDAQRASHPPPSLTPNVRPSPQLSANAKAAPVPLPPPRAVATAELELEVLRLLNQAGADLGEQVSARRNSDGLLRIEGIVETEARKAEIMHALAPVLNDPAVRVEIRTVAEAVAQQQSRTLAAPPPAAEQRVEINNDSIAAAPELRSYFANDEQVRQFAAQMVNRSRQMMRHAYALKRLNGQFSAEELHTFSPEARARWLNLIRMHARSLQRETVGLRQELQPVFFPVAPTVEAEPDPALTDTSALTRAIERLFALASANDRVIRSAFAASPEAALTTGIKTRQFWQSLAHTEALALRIQSAR